MDCTTARVAVFARKQFQLGAVLVSGAIYHTQDCCMMHATVKMCHCFVFFFFFLAGSSLEELYTKSRSPEKKNDFGGNLKKCYPMDVLIMAPSIQ